MTQLTAVTFNGVTYTISDFYGYGLYDVITAGTGQQVERWIAVHLDALADLVAQRITTSASSVAIGTGTKTFVLAADIPTFAGVRGIAVDTANASNYMDFTVTSYTQETRTLVTSVASGDTGGSGTISSWNIMLGTGAKGATGPAADFASIAETNAGTEAAKAVTPDGLAGSNFGLSMFEFYIPAPIVENGAAYFEVPSELAGDNIVAAKAQWNSTIGTGAATSIQLHNLTQAADVFSTNLTIDDGERSSSTAATPVVINTDEDDVTANDVYRADIDAIGSTVAGTGLLIQIFTRRP